MHSCETLLKIHGDLRWADRCEDVAFNSLPATVPPDFRALRYLTAPNQVISNSTNKNPGISNKGLYRSAKLTRLRSGKLTHY